jgi:hypothetical protein
MRMRIDGSAEARRVGSGDGVWILAVGDPIRCTLPHRSRIILVRLTMYKRNLVFFFGTGYISLGHVRRVSLGPT